MIRILRLIGDGVAIALVILVWLELSRRDIRYGVDAHAYWSAWRGESLYDAAYHTTDSFMYAPTIGQLIAPLTWLSWEVFYLVWTALNLALLVLLAGPILAAVLLLVSFEPFMHEIRNGQIHLILATLVVLGFRWPAAWAGVALTKITPAVGLAYFVGARDWRSLTVAIGAVAVLVAISAIVTPDLWVGWVELLQASGSVEPPSWPNLIPGALLPRMAAGVGIALVAGVTGQRWALPIAVLVAMPTTTIMRFVILIAIVPLLGFGPLARLLAIPRPAGWPLASWRRSHRAQQPIQLESRRPDSV